VSVLCGLMAFALPQATQNPQNQRNQTPVFKIESDLVVVDVTVRDRKGTLVGDLTRNDFRIFEDNVPQEIVTFALENIPLGPVPAVPPAGATVAEPVLGAGMAARAPTINLGLNPDVPVKKEELQGKRMIILFFDLSSLGTEDLIRSVDTARDFVTQQAGPQDLVAIATYSTILELIQDLTNDRDVLLSTLNSLSSPESGDTPVEDLTDVDTSEEVFVPDTIQFNIFNTDRRLSAVETLAKMYREFPERKSMIYFTGGVTTTGVENNAQIRSTVDNANRSNLSIYTVDSRGLMALPPGGMASQRSAGGRGMFGGGSMMRQRGNLSASQETLTTLAHDTGGQAFQDSNDLSMAIQQVQADTQIYYVLGYYSTNNKQDGRYRKIRVELSTRTDLRLEHRPGYFAAKSFGQMNQEERDLQLQQALTVDRPFTDVPVIVQADYFKTDGNNSIVPLSIEIAGDGLDFAAKGDQREAQFEFIAQAADPKGRVAGVTRDRVQVRIPADSAERIKSGGIFYSTDFELRPGDYVLKFLVRDNANGKLGSFEQPISVPKLEGKALETSSVILGNRLLSPQAAAGVLHQGSMRRFQEAARSRDPLVVEGKKIIPSIGNVFLTLQTVYVYFQVYGAAPDPKTQKPFLETYLMLLNDNTKILETQPKVVEDWLKQTVGPFGGRRGGPDLMGRGMGRGGFGGMGRGPGRGMPGEPAVEERKGEAGFAIALPLKSLKRGTYTLQIHVRDAVADVNLFRRVPIVIE
jgi:VWFA-related protein